MRIRIESVSKRYGKINVLDGVTLDIGEAQPTAGLLISAQIVLTSLAVQPYCTMFLHSAGTNDTKRINWTSALFVCALIASTVVFIPAAILFFVFNGSLVSWIIGPPVLALVSFSMWRFYGVLYSRHQVDLMPAVTG